MKELKIILTRLPESLIRRHQNMKKKLSSTSNAVNNFNSYEKLAANRSKTEKNYNMRKKSSISPPPSKLKPEVSISVSTKSIGSREEQVEKRTSESSCLQLSVPDIVHLDQDSESQVKYEYEKVIIKSDPSEQAEGTVVTSSFHTEVKQEIKTEGEITEIAPFLANLRVETEVKSEITELLNEEIEVDEKYNPGNMLVSAEDVDSTCSRTSAQCPPPPEETPVRCSEEENMCSSGKSVSTSQQEKSITAPRDQLKQCDICLKFYKNIKVLQNHKSNIHRLRPRVQCDICLKLYKNVSILSNHKRSIHGLNPLVQCDICCKVYKSESSLWKHNRAEHTLQPQVKCNICFRFFKNVYSLDTHKRLEHSTLKGLVQCDICFKFCKSITAVTCHKRFVHDLKATLQCDICSKLFKHRSSLAKHIQHIHIKDPDIKTIECEICHKILKAHYVRYKIHLARHYNIRKHKCEQCSKSFVTKYDLARHAIIHTDVFPFQCNICQRLFKFKGILSRHVKTHNKICKKVVKNVASFKCNYCQLKFNLKSRLKKHLIEMHSNLPLTNFTFVSCD